MSESFMNETLPIIIGTFIVLSSIIAAIVFVIRKQRKDRSNLREQGLLGKGDKGVGNYEGVDYFYEHFQGGKNSPPYFKIGVLCSSTGAFKITRESRFDRFFKRLGICVELETNDPEFDNAFYVTTDFIEFTRRLFIKSDKRRLVMEIFEKGFNEVKFDGKKLTATWLSFPSKNTVEIKTVEEIAGKLVKLGRDIPYTDAIEVREQTGWKLKRFFAFAIPIILDIAGVVGLIAGLTTFCPLDEGKVVLDSFKYSVPLFFVFIWVAVQLLKGRSTSHKELLVVFILSILAFIFAGIGGEMALNGLLDKGEPTVHVANVIDKHMSRNKNNNSYHVVLESWREGEYSEQIKVSRDFYDEIEPGVSKTEVTTKPGKFGFPWLVSFRLATTAERSNSSFNNFK